MDEQATRAQRPWSYAAFIDELKPLIDEVKYWEPKDRDRESEKFKVWRFKVSSLCTRIDRSHVDSTSGLDLRHFRVLWQTSSARDQREAFDRDLRDTITELEHIVEQYAKFGEPAMKATAAAKAMREALKPPQPDVQDIKSDEALSQSETAAATKFSEPEWPKGEKLSLHWVLTHMPLSAWGWLGGALFAAFTFGTTVGSFDSIKSVIASWGQPAHALTKVEQLAALRNDPNLLSFVCASPAASAVPLAEPIARQVRTR